METGEMNIEPYQRAITRCASFGSRIADAGVALVCAALISGLSPGGFSDFKELYWFIGLLAGCRVATISRVFVESQKYRRNK